jgi:Uma2 family endonuclease
MTEQRPLSTSPLPYRLTVEDFLRLDEVGAFAGYGKTELIRGEVFYMNAQHRPHARMKGLLYQAFVQALAKLDTGLDVLIEVTVAMPPHSAPEPDLIVTSEAVGEGPVPIASVRLLVEIADTTQRNDLVTKASVYAENGVAEYWVVDLKDKVVHRMSAPGADGYAEKITLLLGDVIAAVTIAGLAVEVPALN